MTRPVFRFAPSPNGRLHLGHAYSALLNERLARETGGRLLLRIEDIDPARSRPELIAAIEDDLAWLGLIFDGEVRRQSGHFADYVDAASRLRAVGLLYPCFCSRSEIGRDAAALAGEGEIPRDPDGAPLYPGTCRGLSEDEIATRLAEGRAPAWRLRMEAALSAPPVSSPAGAKRRGRGSSGFATGPGSPSRPSGPPGMTQGPQPLHWTRFTPDLTESVISAAPARWGDPVVVRRDTPTSYHLAVVVDDVIQGVTHVVRGRDLDAATDLHVLLQALLGLPSPRYHHHDLIRDEAGMKLAKSAGSRALADLRAEGVTPDAIRRQLGFA